MTELIDAQTPRVFLSHASEDKVRFVEPLARALYERGIKAWLDKWEMRPGDSIVRKIFDEGIGEAQAMVVVVSETSISKPWVREEMDTGFVRRVNEQTRLIPIRLDEAPMPVALQSTIWHEARSDDPEWIGKAADVIAADIYGSDFRPALGPPPAYTNQIAIIPGLTAMDQTVMRLAADVALMAGSRQRYMTAIELEQAAQPVGISPDQLGEVLEVLRAQNYLEAPSSSQSRNLRVRLSILGMGQILRATVAEWDTKHDRIVAELVNRQPQTIAELAEQLDLDAVLTRQVIDELAAVGHLKIADYMGGGTRIHNVNRAVLKRLFSSTASQPPATLAAVRTEDPAFVIESTGGASYRLRNVSRTSASAVTFQVPEGYQVSGHTDVIKTDLAPQEAIAFFMTPEGDWENMPLGQLQISCGELPEAVYVPIP